MPAKRLAGMIRRRKIGCLELLDHYLARVEKHNPAINAIIVTDIPKARRRARAAQRQQHAKELSLLERRISKLSIILGDTEEDLRRVRAGRLVDEGLGSIYDEVQGIDDGDVQFRQKADLMKSIFEANLALRD